MFWADRTNRMTGLSLLLLAALIILTIVFQIASTGDGDPAERDQVSDVLVDINDNEATYFLSIGFSIASDAAIVLAVAGGLYLVFRDRSRLLAMYGLFGLAGGGIAFMAGDAGNVTLWMLAQDFVEKGGAGGIPAGDDVILQAARTVGWFTLTSQQIAFTAIGFGLLSFGALLATARAGLVNPPKWLGGLAILAGVVIFASYLGAASQDLGDVLFIIGNIAALLFLIILGGWLVTQQEEAPEAA